MIKFRRFLILALLLILPLIFSGCALSTAPTSTTTPTISQSRVFEGPADWPMLASESIAIAKLNETIRPATLPTDVTAAAPEIKINSAADLEKLLNNLNQPASSKALKGINDSDLDQF